MEIKELERLQASAAGPHVMLARIRDIHQRVRPRVFAKHGRSRYDSATQMVQMRPVATQFQCRTARRPRSIGWRSARVGTILLALLAAGCAAAVPFDFPKVESTAIPPSDATELGGAAATWSEERDGVSGFHALYDSMDALGARLRLIERAERTIDAQYFVFKGDTTGTLFAAKLMRAADRGVRIRLLIDDIFTSLGSSGGLDAAFALADSHPNFEVRLFNPIARGGSMRLNFLTDFARANRRMHNKSFTVDNAVTIVGGRNIGNEYFRVDSAVEFADLELLGFGPVAAEVSETFDLFWNNELAVPIEAFGHSADNAAYRQFRSELNATFEKARNGVYREATETTFLKDLLADRLEPYETTAEVVTDRPSKLEGPVDRERLTELAAELERAMSAARNEIIVVTPYFVPRREGVEFLADLRAKGVRVAVVTNSLASTNHVAVHSGYAPHRRRLLEAGVELYEVKVDAGVDPADVDGPTRLTLHTKAVVVDRETLFVGSFNLDPRSIDINTEMGLFLDGSAAAKDFAEQIDQDLPAFSYRVVLTDDATIAWRYEGAGEPILKISEPDVGFWRAFKADFFRLLPLEDQL